MLENEDVPPCQQNNLTADEGKQKEAQIFSNAMTLIQNKYWKDVEFNGSLITTLVKHPLDEEKPYNDYEEIHKVALSYLVFNDFNMLFYFKMLREVDMYDVVSISNPNDFVYSFYIHFAGSFMLL